MAERVVDIVDVTPIDQATQPDLAPRTDVPPPVVGRSYPPLPPAAVTRRWGVAAAVSRIVGWLVAAALALAAAWRPVTSELHIIPPVYGVPLGFIRHSTNGWGQVATTHSSFEGADPTSPGQPVAVVFCLCALALVCAALLDAATTLRHLAFRPLGFRPLATRLLPKRLPPPAWVGGSGGLVLAGTVAGIRAERLPRRPLDLPYGIVSQYGSGLWLAGAAVVVAALVCWADLVSRERMDRRSAALGRHPGVAAAGIVAVVLAGAAAMTRAYSVSTSADGSVVYRFAASGAVTRVHRPPAYSALGTALDEVRAVDYLLPLGAAGAILLLVLAGTAIRLRRGLTARTGGLAVPGLFLSGLLAAQLLDDHALATQLRQADASVMFTAGWASLLTGAAAVMSLATWALAAHPERVAGRTWRRRATLDEPTTASSAGADLLL